MIGLLFLVYLLTYVCALLGSRRRFDVNMAFSNEDRILTKKLVRF